MGEPVEMGCMASRRMTDSELAKDFAHAARMRHAHAAHMHHACITHAARMQHACRSHAAHATRRRRRAEWRRGAWQWHSAWQAHTYAMHAIGRRRERSVYTWIAGCGDTCHLMMCRPRMHASGECMFVYVRHATVSVFCSVI